MCVVSMVMDHYNDRFKQRGWGQWPPFAPEQPWGFPPPEPIRTTPEDFKKQIDNILNPPPSKEVQELRDLIQEFRDALKAAKLVDVLTNQPDCEDPKKAELEERVKALEKHLGL